MANTAKQLAQAAIGTGSYTALYTVPGSTKTILKSFDICNTTSGLIKVRVCLVPSGGSPGTANALLYDYGVPGNGIFGWEGEQVSYDAGSTIQTEANFAGLTITASGVEMT